MNFWPLATLALNKIPWGKLFQRRRKCLLVIDDDTVDGGYLTSLLENYGFEVRCVTMADSAYELLRQAPHKYKIAFVDLRLPAMSGLKFIELVSVEFPLVHLCIIAGLPDDLIDLKASTYVGLILKPVSKPSIAAVLLKTKM